VPECQKTKQGGLDQYGAERFRRLIFTTIGKSVGLKGLSCKYSLLCHSTYNSETCYRAIVIFVLCVFNVALLTAAPAQSTTDARHESTARSSSGTPQTRAPENTSFPCPAAAAAASAASCLPDRLFSTAQN